MSKHKKMRFPIRWMKMKIIDTFNTTSGHGLWHQLYDRDTNPPDEHVQVFEWLSEEIAEYLDNEYYNFHSGDKDISKQYNRLIEKYNEQFSSLTTAIQYANDNVINVVLHKYANKWNRLYDAINIDYSPLENYDMTQTETPDITKEKTVATNVTTETKDDVTETAINGFNSTNPVPQGKTTRNGSSTVSGDANDNVETEKETGTRGLTRHGNIGVTTSQQMLQSEIDIRRNFNFFNEIMDDVDSILCLLVY